ncbi:succinylglutamate desuccinylase/aspartoacylase family protein [Dolichospermum sp. ST_con]|nr:succinylglutamate desuccinylase/aspartoacylase family protein [Dolichospermum sp. ST_con]MDD1419852.1 succinylglutamate desuccinylase/aspartoacylase family protein [Dolichospermum sp. ST_sed1]MDD1429017.1 succinylglutamate desuccinylase/aspartoacylase family protein [Dolichospermum sp. ST_sed9]MDD1429958.1 succinylglutamate desuccinylase/aspartoacylase family protein [Dolichospermum sp. ST_sed6]MDD1435931.1 succinylglutamate desuccinylase/aspartoacylase family protein [Dolichospermum sp. ST_
MIPTIATIPLFQLASGEFLSLQVYKFIGAKSGKKVYIQSNLHGAEIVGNAVIYQIIDFLISLNNTQLIGEIWLVPVCNPLAVNQRTHNFSTGRFNIYDGKDWNRIFWDYEKKCHDIEEFASSQIGFDIDTIKYNFSQKIQTSFHRILYKINAPSSVQLTDKYRYKLQSLYLDADYVIDLHSHTGEGIEYLYYFQNREDDANLFLLDYGILFDQYDGDAFDESFIKPWLALEKTLLKLTGEKMRFDIEAWTLELGTGMQINPDSVSKGVRGIKNYLNHKGILAIQDLTKSETISHQTSFRLLSQIKKYWSPVGGMILSKAILGTSVKEGDLLYQVLTFNKIGELPTTIHVHAEKSGLVYNISINNSVNEGEFVLGTM